MTGTKTNDVIVVIKECVTIHKPQPDYSILDISELHLDARTQLLSPNLKLWGNSLLSTSRFQPVLPRTEWSYQVPLERSF